MAADDVTKAASNVETALKTSPHDGVAKFNQEITAFQATHPTALALQQYEAGLLTGLDPKAKTVLEEQWMLDRMQANKFGNDPIPQTMSTADLSDLSKSGKEYDKALAGDVLKHFKTGAVIKPHTFVETDLKSDVAAYQKANTPTDTHVAAVPPPAPEHRAASQPVAQPGQKMSTFPKAEGEFVQAPVQNYRDEMIQNGLLQPSPNPAYRTVLDELQATADLKKHTPGTHVKIDFKTVQAFAEQHQGDTPDQAARRQQIASNLESDWQNICGQSPQKMQQGNQGIGSISPYGLPVGGIIGAGANGGMAVWKRMHHDSTPQGSFTADDIAHHAMFNSPMQMTNRLYGDAPVPQTATQPKPRDKM